MITSEFARRAVHPAMPRLVPMYSEPHRHYHGITHIHDLIRRANEITPALKKSGWVERDFQVLSTAIWFHDCYYDPYAPAGLNEQISAEIMTLDQHAHHWFSPSVRFDARAIILLTAQHSSDLDVFQSMNALGATGSSAHVAEVMLDLDLAGFGDSPEIQKHTNASIRAEYPRTDDSDFYRGREAFLTKLYARDQLYYTPHFAHLQSTARANIAWQLAI